MNLEEKSVDVRLPYVHENMAKIVALTGNVSDRVSDLEDRLASVLRADMPNPSRADDTTEKIGVAPPDVPLAKTMREVARILEDTMVRLEGIAGRLEV